MAAMDEGMNICLHVSCQAWFWTLERANEMFELELIRLESIEP
jgi:hypothetical protein